jgi:hypothetical protein
LYHVEWCSKQDVIPWMCLMYFLSLSTSVYHKWTHPHFKIMQYHKNVRHCLLCLESNSTSMHVLEPGQRKSHWIENLLLKLIIKELNFKSCCSWMHLFKYIHFKDKLLSEQRNQLIPLHCMTQQSNMCHLQNLCKIDLVFKVLFKFNRRKNNLWANVIFNK